MYSWLMAFGDAYRLLGAVGAMAVLGIAVSLYGDLGMIGLMDWVWKGLVILLLLEISAKLSAKR